MGNGQPTKLKL